MIPTKFQFIWPRGFRGEDFFCVILINKNKFLHDYPMNIPTKFGANWPSGFREEH
jgi:hypothetical protein